FRSRSTIITCSAASFGSSTSSPAGRVPLIGLVTSERPRRARKSSGDAETIDHPRPESGRGGGGRSGASRAASPPGRPRQGRGRVGTGFAVGVVAAGVRTPRRLDRLSVVVVGPRPLPRADRKVPAGHVLGLTPGVSDLTRQERQPAGLRRGRQPRAAERLR